MFFRRLKMPGDYIDRYISFHTWLLLIEELCILRKRKDECIHGIVYNRPDVPSGIDPAVFLFNIPDDVGVAIRTGV